MKIKFSYLMLLMALIVAGCAGYFSVIGLSQLFAGSATMVIIMASILEVGKIVTTTALHKYWNDLAKTIKIYLSASVIILMIITSAGIYGFLSNAYQKTANKLEIHESGVNILEEKKIIFEKNISENNTIKDAKTKRIDQLNNLRLNQENRLDVATSNRAKNAVRNDISLANQEIQKLTADIDDLTEKNKLLNDSVNKYSIQILSFKSSSDVAGEVGPLKYISELTNIPMNQVVNYLIILLIFVFDPLAVALIIATNKVFEIEKMSTEPKKITKEDILKDGAQLKAFKLSDEQINNITPQEEVLPTMDPERFGEPLRTNIQPSTPDNIKTQDEPIIGEKTEEPIKETPPQKKIELNDIKEKKENRGFSVNIPKSKNTIQRIGSNKIIKDDNENNLIFNRKK